jgi:hypothetical protein
MSFWFSFIIFELWRNYDKIEEQEERPDYLGSFMYRAFIGLIGIFIINPEFNPIWYPESTWGGIPPACFEASSFYLLFDPILNKLRGTHWLYRGKNSGILDKLGLPYYITLKVFSLIILILSICVIWEIPLPDWLTS